MCFSMRRRGRWIELVTEGVTQENNEEIEIWRRLVMRNQSVFLRVWGLKSHDLTIHKLEGLFNSC